MKTPRPLVLILLCFGLILGLFHTIQPAAQDFQILGIQIGPGGRAQIRHSSRTEHYYLLLRGASPLNMTVAVKASLFGGTNGVLIDPTQVSCAEMAVYRVCEV